MRATLAGLPEDAGDRDKWTFEDDHVRWAIAIVRDTGILPRLAEWQAADQRGPGGAGRRFGTEPLLVAMTLCARTGLPMLASAFRDVLFKHISPTMRRELGLPDPPPRRDHQGWKALDRVVRHRLLRVLELMDPSPYPKNRTLKAADFDRLVADLTPEQIETRTQRLSWFANQILDASVRQLSPDVLARWNGSVALDGTHLPLFARGSRRRNKNGPITRHSSDPDGGWYVREGDHGEGAA